MGYSQHDYEDGISFVLPDDWYFETEIDEDGDTNYSIKYGMYFDENDDEGEKEPSYKFSTPILKWTWDAEEENKTHSSGDMVKLMSDVDEDEVENLKYIILENPLPFFAACKYIVINVLSFEVKSYGIQFRYEVTPEILLGISGAIVLRDNEEFDLKREMIATYQRMLDVISFTRFNGDPIASPNITAEELYYRLKLDDIVEEDAVEVPLSLNFNFSINGHQASYEYGKDGLTEVSRFDPETAYPEQELYPHYYSLKYNPLAFLGNVIVNATGTEYSFKSFDSMITEYELSGEEEELFSRIADSDISPYDLNEIAIEMSHLFRVSKSAFDMKHDRECEINEDLMHRAYMMSALRSFAWTLTKHCQNEGCSPEEVDNSILDCIITNISNSDWLNYDDSILPGLCKGPDLHVYFVPDAVSNSDKQALLPSKEYLEKIEEIKEKSPGYNEILSTVNSLDDLRKDLEYIYPAIEKIYDELAEDRDFDEPLLGDKADVLYAWCCLANAARRPFFTEDGPMNCWFSQMDGEIETIKRPTHRNTSLSINSSVNKEIYGIEETKEDDFYIEDGVLFEYNGHAKNIVLPNSICEIEESAFASSNIVSVVIPESVVKVGESAFSKCEKLEKVTLPSGLDKIPYGAFIHCKKLKEITIPSTVTELGEFAFGWCESLGEITIPGGVYKLGSANEDPFFGCHNLERVYIEDGVKELGSIFGCCGNIKDIYVPSSVKLIDETFYTHPNMVVHVVKGSYAESFFKEDEIVKEILFDYSISALKESDTSYDSSSLSKESEAESDTVILMGDYEVDSSGTLVAYNGCEESIVLPEGVIAIDPDAFLDYKEFVSVVFPEGFETICNYAFYECNLESIEIPNSVTVIGDGAFSHCASLKKVVIPNSITEINLNTFFACTSLTSIKIPDSVTRIGDSAFQGCTGLTSIEIPDSVTKFDINVFLGCDNVTVYSSSNSEAAKYCEKNGIKFVATDIPDEKEVTKYKCPKCGNLVVEGCSSCENCGTPFNWGAPTTTQAPQKPKYKCPTCGGVIEEGTPACPTCGQTFKW